MVETRRSAAAKRSAAVVEEEKGSLASPALEPAEDAPAGLGAGDDVASSQPPKRAKVRIFFHSPFTWAPAAGAVAGPLPNTAGLQARTGAMDKLEAFLKSKEAQSNPAGMSLVRCA